jgi:hypothetical protein
MDDTDIVSVDLGRVALLEVSNDLLDEFNGELAGCIEA